MKLETFSRLPSGSVRPTPLLFMYEAWCWAEYFLDMLAFNQPRPGRVQTPLLVMGAAHDTIFHLQRIESQETLT